MGTRWSDAFSRGFADTHPPAWTSVYEACLDERATGTAPTLRVLELPAGDDPPSPGSTRLALLWPSPAPAPLSDVFPILENLGLRIAAHAGFDVHPAAGPATRVEEFELIPGDAAKLGTDQLQGRVTAAFGAVWTGLAEDDGFNRLVVAAGLSWREVAVLRSTYAYLRQLGTAFTPTYAEQTLRTHPAVAQLLVDLFHARFDPTRQRAADEPAVLERLEAALADVVNLSEDRLLRSFASVLAATTRTNFYQRDETGSTKPYLVLKVAPADLPLVPEPRPAVETFVHSPRMEGLHLRSASVARGGLRWSERPEDYRTEVLGLLQAQRVKNAVIVPHGAKGAFIVKGDASEPEAVRAAYVTFIRGLLDVTDNLVGADTVSPADVVCHDGPDPYLVVAADKGTATFSDLANSIAQEYGFWLGDAFASGGSTGYDHKALGVTARGAWESLRRHLGEMSLNPNRDEVSFVGIGDMSGDVFGNAMLLSDRIRLVAAFDHRHVFLDPDPDPASSYAERRRLFALPRSSWADYRSDLISAGGGVFSRTTKQVSLTPQVRALLDVDAVALPADQLIRAVLRAPVDVLFNGGIGTYVKASTQAQADAGDRDNDTVRVDANQLRARVVVEGGNLGLTQAARVEYALAGGRVNADFIDNSAGVDISDREVNLKILLTEAVRSGRLTIQRRDTLLRQAADQVVAQVLADNAGQAQAISVTQALGPLLVDPLMRMIRYGTEHGLLDLARDVLPDEETAVRRQAAGGGLTRSEIAVLLAMSKSTSSMLMLASDAPDHPPFTAGALSGYLPPALAEFSDLLATHPLRREIAVAVTCNEVFNRMGSGLLLRVMQLTGRQEHEFILGFLASRDVLGLPELWREIDALDLSRHADLQTRLLIEIRSVAERTTRWFLRNRSRVDPADEVTRLRPGMEKLSGALLQVLPEQSRVVQQERIDHLVEQGAPVELAHGIGALRPLSTALDLVEAAHDLDADLPWLAEVYFDLAERLDLAWLRAQASYQSTDSHWLVLAKTSIRDELSTQQRRLTVAILNDIGTETPPRAATDAWLARSQHRMDLYRATLHELRRAPQVDLAMLSVATEGLRTLLYASREAARLANGG